MKNFKILFFLFTFFCFVLNVFSGGITGADVLKITTGGRAMGLSGAYTGIGDDIESIAFNPAGISTLKQKEFQYTFFNSFADINVHSVSYAQPFDTLFLEGISGISVLYRYIPDIKNENASDPPVKYYDMVLVGTYANNFYYFVKNDFFKNINTGINVKLIMEKMREFEASSFAFDIGTQLNFPDSKLKLGFALLNIGLPYKFLEESSPMPLTFRFGSGYNVELNKDNNLKIAVDFVNDFYGSEKILFGLEDAILNLIFLRAGYDMPLDSDTPSSLSLGAGISITQFDVTVMLNYVWKPVFWIGLDNFDSTHILSLQVKL